MEKIWKRRGASYASAEEYILAVSGATREELLSPKKVDPSLIQNLPAASDCIADAIQAQIPVIIVGDYDADGITSCAILSMLFSRFGVTPRVIIPRRFTDGYGISEKLIDDIHDSLIVCVDNGIVAVGPVALAKSQNNRVVILDHHLPSDTLPDADVIVDPHVQPDQNAYVDYCGAGLSLKLAEYMLPDPTRDRRLFYNMNALACLGTIADVVPLTGDNRRIVKDGLRIINHSTARASLNAGLRCLIDRCGLPFDEETVAFQTAPMINAPGRMYNAGSLSVLKALLCTDEKLAAEYIEKLQQINQDRKEAVASWQRRYAAKADPEKKVQLIYLPGAPEGIIGIIAGKLAEEYHTPALVFTDSLEPGIYKGSGRSAGDFDLSLLTEHLRPLTVKCGGHAGAAGLSVAADKFDALKAAAEAFMQPYDFGDDWKYEFYDVDIRDEDVAEAYRTLKEYAPFGEGLRRPVFVLRGCRLQPKFGEVYRKIGKGLIHVKLHGSDFDAMGFYLAERYEDALGAPETLDLLGSLTENVFRGTTTVQFNITAMALPGEQP